MATKETQRSNLKIAGYEKIVGQLHQLRDYLENSNHYVDKGIKIPKGVLLTGNPGVGKTVMAKSIANDGINFLELRSADCTKRNSEEYIQKAFAKAKTLKPCVLLIDELDKIAGMSDEFYMEMNDKAMKVLLQELDGLKSEDGVLVVSTCNDLRQLNQALIRSGRFDRVYQVHMPTLEDREKIIKLYLDKVKIKKTVNVNYLARMTSNCSGAQLETFVNESAIIAVEENDSILDLNCFQRAMDRVLLQGVEGPINETQKHMVAVHEAGHCLVRLYLAPDSISGASIIPHGQSSGRSRFLERRPAKDGAEELDDIEIALAGRAAEILEFATSSTGCADDIRKAILAADYLIAECGKFGLEYVINFSRIGILSKKQEEQACIKRTQVLNELHEKATALIQEHKDVFYKIVKTLEEKHVITRDELLALKN